MHEKERERERWMGVREHVEQKGHDGDHHNNNLFIKRNYDNEVHTDRYLYLLKSVMSCSF